MAAALGSPLAWDMAADVEYGQATSINLNLGPALEMLGATTRMSALVSLSGNVAGSALAGSFCVGILTPQRNVMTMAAKDTTSTVAGLYRQVFRQGPLGAFRGGAAPVVAAMPQFAAIGPVYHAAKGVSDSAILATAIAAGAESLFTFGAQRRNAQIQFNAARSAAEQIAITKVSRPVGPGFSFHVARNFFAMTGIRSFSPYTYQGLERITPSMNTEAKQTVADLTASMAASVLSMPFNHVFSWAACTPELNDMSLAQRLRAAGRFLVQNYQQQGVKLLMRDLHVRIGYTTFLFTIYNALERRIIQH